MRVGKMRVGEMRLTRSYSGADPVIQSPQQRWEMIYTHSLTMQYKVIKFQTIGELSSVNPPYNSHQLPNRG